jgi:hypothetical protein
MFDSNLVQNYFFTKLEGVCNFEIQFRKIFHVYIVESQMTLLSLINHAFESEKRLQISIPLAPYASQCNISLVLGVNLMIRTFIAC